MEEINTKIYLKKINRDKKHFKNIIVKQQNYCAAKKE